MLGKNREEQTLGWVFVVICDSGVCRRRSKGETFGELKQSGQWDTSPFELFLDNLLGSYHPSDIDRLSDRTQERGFGCGRTDS